MLLLGRNEDYMPSFMNDWMDWNKTAQVSPKMNIIESKENYEVELSVPGLTKQDLNITIDADNDLVIEMNKETNNQKHQNRHFLRREFSMEQFREVVALPENIEKDKISAKVENGVLVVTMPKMSEETKKQSNKTIEIQ